jgi:uncharacterized protein (DUF1800 family)
MVNSRRNIAFGVLLAAALAFVQLALAKKKTEPASLQMDEHKRVYHALNRLTFGPRPGDEERVAAMGVDKWIALQLHPEKIDDGALDARLAPLRTLRMPTREIVENFPPPQVIKQIAEGKESLPRDPAKRAIYQAQLERYQEKQENKEQAAKTATPDAAPAKPGAMSDADTEKEKRLGDDKAQELLNMPPDKRIKAIFAMSPEERQSVAKSMRGKREELMEGFSPQQQETVMALNGPQQVVDMELAEGKLLRAIYGERQLQEVMTDFWFNHFNVFLGKGADRYLLTSYERDVIRPRAMGKFEDLLVATAKSPAMLFYLDNWLSVGPNSDFVQGIPNRANNGGWGRRRFPPPPRKGKPNKRAGLNENYGRELMELHTLGVNGGYSQRDVTEVARVFTGWTLKQPREGGDFNFNERMHDSGDKTVLGHRIKPNGEKEGLEVLHILAHHPSTAKFICTKLAMRFVSDNPPPALVQRMSETFLKKNGEIRDVIEIMLRSPEFWSPDVYRAKVKTPLEFVVSAVRASGADVTDALPLVRQLQNMGMPLYGMQPPTGYSMKAETWVNSSALLGRMNFSLALAAGRLPGTRVDVAPLPGSTPIPAEQSLATLEARLLSGDVSKQTHDTIVTRLNDPKVGRRRQEDANAAQITGLLLGSPEFQKR